MLRREKEKLERTLGGIRDMAKIPSAIWVVDTKKEHIAVGEARKLGIPVIAMLDTNCDPDEVDLPIPGNDDAIRSVALLTRVIADAVAEGLMARAGGAVGAGFGARNRLAEWERELLAERVEPLRLLTEMPEVAGAAERGRRRPKTCADAEQCPRPIGTPCRSAAWSHHARQLSRKGDEHHGNDHRRGCEASFAR